MKEKGVLLAVSALPSPYGVGDFGLKARELIRILARHEETLWQILPLNPAGYGHSPYQPYSSYAFDEAYLSLEELLREGLLKELPPRFKKARRVHFEEALAHKMPFYRKAYRRYYAKKENREELRLFMDAEPKLVQYGHFMALKKANQEKPWPLWRIHKPRNLLSETRFHVFLQMKLLAQWQALHAYANARGVRIVGDIPFYCGYDSSDVYFDRKAFKLDKKGQMTVVAGVAPDYFSKEGQRWGNPIWNFKSLAKRGYAPLIDRLVWAKDVYDIVRLDHFRAFDTRYEIPASSPNAIKGRWVITNGRAILDELYRRCPAIELIAEDLGDLRPEVLALRDHYDLPGMNVLQFTFFPLYIEGSAAPYGENSITYLGTHDNAPIKSWYSCMKPRDRKIVERYFATHPVRGHSIPEKMVTLAYQQASRRVILLAQDILLESGHNRINIPSTINDRNWTYRLRSLYRLEKALAKVRHAA